MSPFVPLRKARSLEWQDKIPKDMELLHAYQSAAKHQPMFVRAFNKLIRRLTSDRTMARLKFSIRSGSVEDIDKILSTIEWMDQNNINRSPAWKDIKSRFDDVYGKVVEESGKASGKRGVIVKQETPFSFDLDNPFSLQWIDERSAELITSISIQAQETIRQVIFDGFQNGVPVDQMAREIRRSIGLTARDAQAAKNRFSSLLDQGFSDDLATKKTDVYASQLLNRRAKAIARTETIAAEANGVQQSWLMAQEQGVLPLDAQRIWIASVGSLRVCPTCTDLNGRTALIGEPFESAFEGSVMNPPAHALCRCATGQISPSFRTLFGDVPQLRVVTGTGSLEERRANAKNHVKVLSRTRAR